MIKLAAPVAESAPSSALESPAPNDFGESIGQPQRQRQRFARSNHASACCLRLAAADAVLRQEAAPNFVPSRCAVSQQAAANECESRRLRVRRDHARSQPLLLMRRSQQPRARASRRRPAAHTNTLPISRRLLSAGGRKATATEIATRKTKTTRRECELSADGSTGKRFQCEHTKPEATASGTDLGQQISKRKKKKKKRKLQSVKGARRETQEADGSREAR